MLPIKEERQEKTGTVGEASLISPGYSQTQSKNHAAVWISLHFYNLLEEAPESHGLMH
jgi:hypothetical protein